ncbi:unnamed protein product [Caenorhabditis brenneri]
MSAIPLSLFQPPQPPDASVVTSQSASQLHWATPSWPSSMICKVCGGRAIGERYGVLSCAPCGKYFNRNKEKSIGQCKRNGNCNHTLWRCNPCRFKKCLEAGMSVQRLNYQFPPRSPDNAGNSTFFREAQRKQPIGDCKEEGNCQLNRCVPCRYRKCLKAGTRQEKEIAHPRIPPTTAIVHEIIAAHHLICEYTEEKMKKMVVKEYPWTPDKNTDQKTNRLYAWKVYSMQVNRDIKSTIFFIRQLENNLSSAEKAKLVKEHAFKMHMIRISRALSRNGLLLPDGRLIDSEFFKALYGEQLAEEMITFADQALNIFKLDDDGFAMLLTMCFYSEFADNNLVFFRIEAPQALKNLSQEYRRNFIRWCDSNKAPRTFRNIQLMLDRLKQLDELHKTDVIDFLRGNAEHFSRKGVFAEVYLSRYCGRHTKD